MTQPLISDAYRAQQTALHADNAGYGSASVSMAPLVARVARLTRADAILDYGAGKQRLAVELAKHIDDPMPIRAYDPAVPEIASPPEPADMVACIDVLEHIEPDYLDAVIDDLARVTRKNLIASIASGPAIKTLSDGRNAHLIQQPAEWWLPQLWRRFTVLDFSHLPHDRFWLRAIVKRGE
ncbi:MAG: hypothetical protein HQ481_13190 [Alphaproteobacteria bacterium]|nr:hypothetical protein [Alphaproteobacteria bacterium]